MDKKTEARKRIKSLVARFEENISQYKRTDYDEANTRVDFIDPFFEALGWDVANRQGFAEQYREVVREAKVIIVGKHKAPDYSFRIGGIRKFFVEAKKPFVDLKHDISPAFQLRRYAYTAKLPLSILIDFEEFSVYDTRIKPSVKDSASVARIFYCNYKDYIKNFNFIYDTFSKDAILKGSFDKYIETTKKKRGTSEVDKEFLKLIDEWREKLAKNIALRNKKLSLHELNFAVQKIIDRIIFLRIAEDRQIEDYGKLQILVNGANVYGRLKQIFYHSDRRYNSGLFDFKKDRTTPNLSIDDKVIKEIIKSVYYPDSPYEFSVLGVEILGNIYEQFLGKTIRLTPAHQVKVEEKPEVKKAGGVYYTPKYIVDYIVKNTVGEIIKKKTPKQIEKIKILDPACGSGSFLLGAYQWILDEHLNWYSKKEHYKRALKQGKIIQTGKESYQLSVGEKQRILTNNIFGVDIDSQAVEVSKLSLLLKLLEGETEESTGRLFKYSQIKLLPDLSNNIKCGNSLIGPDYFEGRISGTIDEDELRKINPFDWQKEFPEIFAQGGFDAVIGNPPYVRVQTLQQSASESIEYFKKGYLAALKGNIDLYLIFLEKGYNLLSGQGKLGFILPHKFFTAQMGETIRKYLAERRAVKEIINFGTNQIFENATTYTCLLFLSKKRRTSFLYKRFDLGRDVRSINLEGFKSDSVKIEELHKPKWNFYVGKENSLLAKLTSLPIKLEDITSKIFKGSSTGNDSIFLVTPIKKSKEKTTWQVISKIENEPFYIESKLLKPFLKGEEIKKYGFLRNHFYLIFPYKIIANKSNIIEFEELKKNYPFTAEYFIQNKKMLSKRKIQTDRTNFYKYSAARSLIEYEKRKILVPDILVNNRITIDLDARFYHGPAIHSIIIKENQSFSLLYLLSLLNSKVFWFFLTRTSTSLRGDAYRLTPEYIKSFPIPKMDFAVPKEKKMHDDLVAMVDKMLKLQKKYHSTRMEHDKKLYKTQIDHFDNQIDTLVYKLYGLTKEEIKVVEGA